MERLVATPIERDVVLVRGGDAAEYLQTQLTQDVVALAVGSSAWSFLLEPKSEIAALLRVTRAADDLVLMDIEPGYGSRTVDRIDGFLGRMDVTFEVETWPGIAWRGPGSGSIEAPSPIVARCEWPGVEGTDVLGPDVRLPDDAHEMCIEGLEAMRIGAGWPAMGSEIDGVATPAMTGLVSSTVSFTKGCYTGQEFVARVHYRDAAPPRRLVGLRFHPCASISAGDELAIDDDTAGSVTSVATAQPIGLAYLKRSVEAPGDAMIGTARVSFEPVPSASH